MPRSTGIATHVCNLRSHRFDTDYDLEHQVYQVLDAFCSRYLHARSTRLIIIFGKGMHSRRKIEGKHPLRYYTEKYLSECGWQWKPASMQYGGDGACMIDL